MKPKISWPLNGTDHGKKYQIVETKSSEELLVFLIGKTGSGKSASGNTILGREVFVSDLSGSSVTKTCQQETVDLGEEDNDCNVMVVDTPGFGDTHLSEEEVHTEISKCVALSAYGPHAFLLVVPLGRYTEDEDRAVNQLAQIFGEEVVRHRTLVLFTGGDKLKGRSVEDFLKTAPPALHALIDRCGGRYHVFNNEVKDSVQVKELISKVKNVANQTVTGYSTSATREEQEEQRRQMRRRSRPAGGDQAGNSSSNERQIQPDSSSSCKSGFTWNSWWEAALSPKVLGIIKPMVAALLAGAAIGATFGVAVPLVIGAASVWLAVGAATGAVVGGMMGAVVGTEIDSPSEAVQKAVNLVGQVGRAAKAAKGAAAKEQRGWLTYCTLY